MASPPRPKTNRPNASAPRGNGPNTPPPKPAAPLYAEFEPKLPPERVGDILRKVREKRGDDLTQIADYLCIRHGFLQALENNRYDELPADAYVIGFLRSYANYLGLDGRDMIDRYRSEMAGRRKKPILNMPIPVAEGRAPSVAVMIGAAITALLVYAVWYGFSASDRAVVTAPPPLPTATEADAADGAVLPPAGNPLIVAPIPVPAAPAATAPVAVPPPAPASPATLGGQIYGDAAAGAHVVVRAEKESWVLVSDDKGHTVFDRVLKPGDSYKVPETGGLTLTTGNSNAIVIVLDGADLPKFSGNSRVIRGLPLDIDKLKAAVAGQQE